MTYLTNCNKVSIKKRQKEKAAYWPRMGPARRRPTRYPRHGFDSDLAAERLDAVR